jgi:hypothetical protein
MMLRRLLAAVVIGLLIMAPLTGALATKPQIAGKGNPTLWGDPDIPGTSLGDPDWPAFSKETGNRRRIATQFNDPGILGSEPSTSPGRSVTAIGRESWWSSLLFELGIRGLNMVTWRR